MRKTIHFIVSGRVQGVFFRASTRQSANELGLCGWVRNLPDGRVEGMASGESKDIARFKAWLGRGPEMAKVQDVQIEEVELQEFAGFEVR